MSLVSAERMAASGNALVDAPDRLGEVHRRAAAVLTHMELALPVRKTHRFSSTS